MSNLSIKIFLTLFLLVFVMVSVGTAQRLSSEKYKVTVSPDSIMSGGEQTIITVHIKKKGLKFTCFVRKGGGEYGDFAYVTDGKNASYQATFKTRFPGEMDIIIAEITEYGYNPVGQTILNVFGPDLTLDYDFNIDVVNKSMGINVELVDFRYKPIEDAELAYKIYQVKGKRKTSKTEAKLDPFVYKQGKYYSKFRFVEYGDYEIHVWDKSHFTTYLEAGEEVRDNPHPFDKIIGLTIELD